MSLFIAGIFIGAQAAPTAETGAATLPPTARRWVIRGREVEASLVALDTVFAYEDRLPAPYPLKYFMAAAKPVEEVES